MASVTMSQAPSTYSSTNSSTQSNYSENDLSSNFGRIKFTDGPTLVVCDIDSDGCASSSPVSRPSETDESSNLKSSNGEGLIAGVSPSSSTHSVKEAIERSPSTSSLSVPTVDVDEKRPPLPEENMMIDDSI